MSAPPQLPVGTGRRGARCRAGRGVIVVSASCREVLRSLHCFVVQRVLQKPAVLAGFLLRELCV